MNQLYVIEELVEGKWIPTVGGGSSSKPHVRAFESLESAKKAIDRIPNIRGYELLPKNTKRRISVWKREEE